MMDALSHRVWLDSPYCARAGSSQRVAHLCDPLKFGHCKFVHHSRRLATMPGLLQTPDDMFGSARFISAVAAEFLVRSLPSCLKWNAARHRSLMKIARTVAQPAATA